MDTWAAIARNVAETAVVVTDGFEWIVIVCFIGFVVIVDGLDLKGVPVASDRIRCGCWLCAFDSISVGSKLMCGVVSFGSVCLRWF